MIVGGVIIIAVNSLLYLNQSVPPYGVSLNSISAQSTLFPLRQYTHTLVHLCFLNRKINLKICVCDQYLSKKFFECLCTHLDYWCIQMIVLPVNEVLYSLWQVYRRVWGLHWTAVRPPSCLMTRLSYPSKGENCELHSVL